MTAVPRDGEFRHYTDLEGAKGIRTARHIMPGRSGQVFLTAESFETGAAAGWRLAIWPAKRLIGAAVVDLPQVPGVRSGEHAIPIFDEFGVELRRGCALEWSVPQAIEIEGFQFARVRPPRSPEDAGFRPGARLPAVLSATTGAVR